MMSRTRSVAIPPITILAVLLGAAGAAGAGAPRFRYREIAKPGGKNFGQTSLVDLDRDGDLDFVSGRSGGTVFWFEQESIDSWKTHLLGEEAKTDVGGVAIDVDGDGWIDQVSGGAWYRNPGKKGEPFSRHVTEGIPTHDTLAADVDGDGKKDIVGIADSRGVFWYSIPKDPTGRWPEHRVAGVTEPQCHGGIAVGDLDGDGDADISRVDRWFENQDGKGLEWKERKGLDFGTVGPWGIQSRARILDVDRDGDNDLIQTEGDVKDGRVAWFENRGAEGFTRHLIRDSGKNEDFHALVVADLDRDGDPDILSSGGPLTAGERKTYVWENLDGKGGSWKEHVVHEGIEGHESVGADIDGDGDIDIASKPWASDTHYLLENVTPR